MKMIPSSQLGNIHFDTGYNFRPTKRDAIAHEELSCFTTNPSAANSNIFSTATRLRDAYAHRHNPIATEFELK